MAERVLEVDQMAEKRLSSVACGMLLWNRGWGSSRLGDTMTIEQFDEGRATPLDRMCLGGREGNRQVSSRLGDRAVANAAIFSAGQKCTATSRVIVDAAIADRFTAELGGIADEMTVGDPLDSTTEVGPLSAPATFGTGASSSGPSEQGKAAIEFYTKWKSIYIRHS